MYGFTAARINEIRLFVNRRTALLVRTFLLRIVCLYSERVGPCDLTSESVCTAHNVSRAQERTHVL